MMINDYFECLIECESDNQQIAEGFAGGVYVIEYYFRVKEVEGTERSLFLSKYLQKFVIMPAYNF